MFCMSNFTNVPTVVYDNHKALMNIFCKSCNGLKIFYFNARSLNGNKLDYVRYVFENTQADILCISETWFKVDIPVSAYSIDKYTLFRNDRVYSRGGGVAIYCRSMFKATLVSKSVDSFVEFLNIQVCGYDFKLLVSCVYNPQRCASCEPYFADLAPRSIDYDFLAVLGDFNINILANDVLSRDIV